MGRIGDTFTKLQQKNEKALIPFLMAGDPNLELTKELVLTAEENGADLLELGIPYSAPLADGPTIQKAAQRSLAQGTNLTAIFKLVEDIREESELPLILMGYYNSIFSFGLEKFVKRCAEAGVDGVIIPDLPPEEGAELQELSTELDIILLLASTSNQTRIEKVTDLSSGFIYAVSTPGVTGARAELSTEVKKTVTKIKDIKDIPVAVGFGISSPTHAQQIGEFADGIIVGSAIIERIEKNLDLLERDKEELIAKVSDFISSLKEPLTKL
ncbi:tryptophan synthase subunit alpha [Natroniella sulfidigena]|uniref:tryptophan synthase subunit alpha n=1 Tax=Natroniella sulfidigena TaxID=723921 RepID=UPI00200A480D|nr:tryptophan synthase subunit alpha [Natroniella sulfidigena]